MTELIQRLDRTRFDVRVACFQHEGAWLPRVEACAPVTDLIYGSHETGTGGCSTPPAVAGYPHITVPVGFLYGLPVGVSFFGRAWSEETLLRLAYAFEQATRLRKAPQFLPTYSG